MEEGKSGEVEESGVEVPERVKITPGKTFGSEKENNSANLVEDVRATAATSAPDKVLDQAESRCRVGLNLANRTAPMNFA